MEKLVYYLPNGKDPKLFKSEFLSGVDCIVVPTMNGKEGFECIYVPDSKLEQSGSLTLETKLIRLILDETLCNLEVKDLNETATSNLLNNLLRFPVSVTDISSTDSEKEFEVRAYPHGKSNYIFNSFKAKAV